jgi:3-oxoacyl-[acyl-carrier protein] reductase
MGEGFNFQGKKVIITGAAGIFGSWIAKAFDEAGADLWLVDQNKEGLQEVVQTLSNSNNINISILNLLEEKAINTFFDEVATKWSSPDYLINNAGIYPSSLMLDLSTDTWDEVMDINVKVPFLMMNYFSKLLIKEDRPGAVVNIISRSAKIPRVGAVHYAISKAALEMMTRGASMELAKYNIRVNAVSPGFAPGSKHSFLSEEYIDAMCKKIPLGRTSGPNDAPQTILYLCSDKSSFITGTSIYVDGGNTAGDFNIPVIED